MKKETLDKFNALYSNAEMYYGWELRREFLDYVEKLDLNGCRALDLGCGEGRYSVYLAERGCNVTAVDLSEIGIRKTRKIIRQKGFEIQAIVEDVEKFVLPGGYYDLIVAVTILDHLENPGREKVIQGIKTALKYGGIAFVYVLTTADPGFQARQQIESGGPPPENYSETAFGIEYYFQPQELARKFSGLEILFYREGTEPDLSHGRPHRHGFASMIIRRPNL